ncbi:MAG: EI24 domain-containing protein [Cetobacterium sp.]|uniref:EI24 domain-containing protein n=1 Tax=Cetobacterium sp. TaxID=2071632 RepID=UPI003F3EACE3
MEKVRIMLESYLSAPKLIRETKLRWGYLVGAVIGVLIVVLFFLFSNYIGKLIFDKINIIFSFKNNISLLKIGIVIVIRFFMISIQYFFFKTILLILLAPFFSYVSEKIESLENKVKYNFTLKENIIFLVRGINIASKSFFKEIFYTIFIILLGFIPVINIFVPILIFIVQSYFISYNFVDYTLERHKFSSKESSDFMWDNKIAFSVGGAIFTLLYFIPIIGIFIAPLISIVAFTNTTLKFLKDK